jgi:hypothetical protein
MARMGHDSERAALIYLHSSAERQRTLADEVGRMAAAELAKSKTAEPSGTLTARKPNGSDGPADGKSPDLTLWGTGPFGAGAPFPLLSPVDVVSGLSHEFGEGGPAMSVYVGIDVHRKRSQVAVIDEVGEVIANRNVTNGVGPILSVIGELPAGTPAAFEAAFGWGWLLELRVGVRGGLLYVAQRHPGVEGGCDERVPQRMRADVLGDPGAAGDPADDPGCAVPVQPPPVRSDEKRPCGALADGQVDRASSARGERDGDDLAALAGDDQGAVAAFQAHVLDVRAGGLRYPQPV